MNYTNAAETATSQPDAGEITLSLLLRFLLGAASLMILLLFAYTSSVLIDRCCRKEQEAELANFGGRTLAVSRNTSPAAAVAWNNASARAAAEATSSQESDRRVEATIAGKASLYGLHDSERVRILEAYFQPGVYVLPSTPTELLSSRPNDEVGTCESRVDGVVDEVTIEQSPVAVDEEAVDLRETSSAVASSAPSTARILDLSHDNPSQCCCICLLPYEPGTSLVMTGSKCDHMFHYDCCKEWLVKHDHCPYCRQDMIEPMEFRVAAIHALGTDRVDELTERCRYSSHPIVEHLIVPHP